MISQSKNTAGVAGLLPVIAAFTGNVLVFTAKLAGFALTGSGAMFAESVHSLADTANQSLLIIGVRKSIKKPDEEFPYGYGRERFIWALISACGIFFIGCGVTVYRGVVSLFHPEAVHASPVSLYILAAAFIIESFTLYLAIRDIRKHFPDSRLRKIMAEADPTTLAVVYEDGLAVIGVLIAFASIILSKLTGQIYWDVAGSIIIGLLLGVIAVMLIAKNRNYLITKSIPKETEELIREIMQADPTIEKVLDFKSAIIDVDKYLIKCDVEFNAASLIKALSQHHFLEHEYEEARESYANFMKFSVDYMDRVPRLVGKKIDELEKKIRTQVPEAIFIDIEIN
ncbi:MAG: cation transporter [Patescibacteria group bacterium]